MLNKLRNEILNEVRPSQEECEKIKKIIDDTSNILEDYNKSNKNFPYKFIQPQGSTGIKQTQLKNSSDIDLFILLSPNSYSEYVYLKEKKKNIKENSKSSFNKDSDKDSDKDTNIDANISDSENQTEKQNQTNRILFNKSRIEKLIHHLCHSWVIPALKLANYKDIILSYAEHPYVSASYDGYDIDVVFAFFVEEEFLYENGPITAVDRTYYHSKFIQEHLTEDQKDDVRVLKKFFQSQLSYGDKAPIGRGGFIGYSIELLIYHFKNLEGLFKNFKDLPYQSMDYYNRRILDLRKITRFMNDFLLIMDPTDKKRNVAASISARAWIHCKYIIDKILEEPLPDYFLEKNICKVDLKSPEIIEHYVVIEVRQQTDDHYTKIRDKLYSLAESLKNLCLFEKNSSSRFPGVDYAIYFDPPSKNYVIVFFTETTHIDEQYLRKGPKANGEIHHLNFQQTHPDMFIKDGYCFVYNKRNYTDFLTLLESETKKRIFEEIEIVNISIPQNAVFEESMNAISVLKHNILPYNKELALILKKITPKTKKKVRKHNRKFY